MMPLTPLFVLVLSGLLVFLFVLIQIDVLSFAFAKLGLSPGTGILVLFGSLLGSAVNIPLFSLRAEKPPVPRTLPKRFDHLQELLRGFEGRIVVAVNLGGCLIPVGVSLYLLHIHDLPLHATLLGVAGVALASYLSSRPIQGVGIGMPLFVAPVVSVLLALLLYPPMAAPLAYISGTLGVLIGADLLHLPTVSRLGAPLASIGGAGTFDGIFFTGVLAALLA
jgi:uncharacterized membrane protein